MHTGETAVSAKVMRHQGRRDLILDAASQCFIEHGFHGASMALVASAAQISVGQIYRYFTSKEQIISAIVARELEQMIQKFPKAPPGSGESREQLSAKARLTVAHLLGPKHTGLIIEIRAEAARNPVIAQIVREADTKIGEHLRAMFMAATLPANDPVDIRLRAKYMAIVIDGLIFRSPIDGEVDSSFAETLIDLVSNARV